MLDREQLFRLAVMCEEQFRRIARCPSRAEEDHRIAGMERKAGTPYEIRVRGRLDPCWSDWFDGFSITYPSAEDTLLSGRIVDQAALQGLLTKVWDLGLSVLVVQPKESKHGGEK